MSQHDHPNAGYVIPLNEFVVALNRAYRMSIAEVQDLDEFIEKSDEHEIQERLEQLCNGIGWPAPEVLKFTPEDFSDELDLGITYVYFLTQQLYELKPSAWLLRLHEAGLKPEEASWTKWG